MPQFTTFPFLPSGDPQKAVNELVMVCREVPAEGEPFKQFRKRLRERQLWHKERYDGTLRFFCMTSGDVIKPSPLMLEIRATDSLEQARDLLADRLWQINSVLFKAIVERLADSVHPPKEMFGYIDSFAYRGEPIPRVELEAWFALARGIGVIRKLGIALGIHERGKKFLDEARQLDLEEFFEEDEPEVRPDPIVDAATVDATESVVVAESPPTETGAVIAAVGNAAVAAPEPTVQYKSPRGRGPSVPAASFAGADVFSDEVLADTAERMAVWWSEQIPERVAASIGDFGIDGETWMNGAEEALYRTAVAAALAFRLSGSPTAAQSSFRTLEAANVLDDLYYGTAPESLPDGVDPKALMLASLVARRCAEAPELAATLEKQSSAGEAFAALDAALGRGLFRLELFWIMRALAELGAIRFDDAAEFTAVPTRLVRDTVYRLGFLASPYASDAARLVPAAAAVRRAAGSGSPADEVIAGFALAAGCAYDCPNRRTCEYACKERAE